MEHVPNTSVVPIPQPSPTGHAAPTAHFARQELPLDASFKHEQNASEGRTIRHTWPSTFGFGWLRWEERGNNGP
jgi:hypothetical protein